MNRPGLIVDYFLLMYCNIVYIICRCRLNRNVNPTVRFYPAYFHLRWDNTGLLHNAFLAEVVNVKAANLIVPSYGYQIDCDIPVFVRQIFICCLGNKALAMIRLHMRDAGLQENSRGKIELAHVLLQFVSKSHSRGSNQKSRQDEQSDDKSFPPPAISINKKEIQAEHQGPRESQSDSESGRQPAKIEEAITLIQ
jgi:hypothetical protein